MKMDEAVHVAAPEPCAKTGGRDRRGKDRLGAGRPAKRCGWKVRVESAGGGWKTRGKMRVEKICKTAGGRKPANLPQITTLRQIYLSNKVH